MPVVTKRAYEPPAPDDGIRVLVDRYWPRGLSRDQLQITRWEKELAPSPSLIAWFGHRPERWEEFRRRYWDELRSNQTQRLEHLVQEGSYQTVSLVFGARDTAHNNAVALAQLLRTMLPATGADPAGVERADAEIEEAGAGEAPPPMGLLVFSLLIPLLGFAGAAVAVALGPPGWLALALVIGAYGLFVTQRTEQRRMAVSGPDAEPWWAALRGLVPALAASLAGVVCLGGLVMLLAAASHALR